MIITHLGGGLGNQMFQYALGRKLSIKNNDALFLDTTEFEGNREHKHYRAYGLHHFNINAAIATKEQITSIKYPYGKIVAALKNRFDILMGRNGVKFEPYILRKRGDVYLNGFWQCEKYFKDIRNTLLKEFSLKESMSESASKYGKMIRIDKNSVSLHVRRGDYAESEESKRYFGTHCDEAYYLKALETLSEKKGDLSVYVFSDDIEWVKANIRIPHKTTYVSEKSCPDYERLILMSLTESHILANSTFGWWGAWLDNKPEKIVIAPSIWIPGPRLPVDDILPPEWIRI